MTTVANRLILTHLWNGEKRNNKFTNGDYEIDFKLNLESNDMVISVSCPFFDDPMPMDSDPHSRYIGLWNYEVVEIFLASGLFEIGSKNNYYIEIELGPYGNYYIASFPYEGAWKLKNDQITLQKSPITRIDRTNMRWYGEMSLPCYLVPEPLIGDDYETSMSCIWMMNAFAIHGQDCDPEYLAFSPCEGSTPNFHQLKSFVPVLVNEVYNDITSEDTAEVSSEPSDDEDSREFESIYSVIPPTNPNRRLPKHVANLPFRPSEYSSRMNGTRSNTASPIPSFPHTSIPTSSDSITDVCQSLKVKFGLPELSETVTRRFLCDDEFVVLYSTVTKRKGWSYKKRMLILTSKPRLLYTNVKTSSSAVKGQIPWAMLKPITITKIDENHFDIQPYGETRWYHFDDRKHIDHWIEAITTINEAWGNYLKSNVGKCDIKALAQSMSPTKS